MPLDPINAYLEMNAKGQKAPELVGEQVEPKVDADGFTAPYIAADLASDDITRLDKKANNNGKKKPYQKHKGPSNRPNDGKGPQGSGQRPNQHQNRRHNPNGNSPNNKPKDKQG
jgi:hypothetical protein